MVSSGDSGSAGCDETTTDNNRTVTQATGGLQVSGFSSTPYNISVGGTDFYTLYTSNAVFESLVNTSNGIGLASSYYRTALGYIPESTWNDSTYSDTTISANEPWTAISGDSSYANIVAGAGGASSIYSKPSWQSATGVPSDGKRDLPDVSLMAGNEFDDAVWAICDDATDPSAFSPYPNAVLDCSSISAGDFDAYGGTSTSSPSFAGILAMVEQKTSSRLGLPAQTLYTLYGTAPAAFHDITVGNNSVPCTNGSLDCVENTAGYDFESGYNTTTGYDLATGLGSVDATKLVNAWSSATGSDTATVTFTSISPNPATTIESITVVVTVSGSDGTPTGTVTLTGGSYNSGAQTLASGSYTFTIPAGDLPIGNSDTLTANYSGNSTYATATNSATETVTGLTAKVTASATPSSINSNQTMTVTGTVACTGSCAGSTTPTGTVTLTGGGYTSPATALSGGSYSITIPANSLSAGNDTLTVTYSGNSIYDAGAFGTTTVDVTLVVVLTPTVTVTPASSSVDSSQSLNVTVTVAGSGATPTGTVTLTSGSYNSGAQTLGAGGCTAASCVITIPANSLNVGNEKLTATYSGDANYAPGVGTASVTVTQSAYALAATTPSAIAPGASTTSTVAVSSSTFYTGTVTLSCALTSSPSGAEYPPTCSITSGSTVDMSAGTPAPTSSTAAVNTTPATPPTSELVYPKLHGGGWAGAGGGAILALLVFLGIPAQRRSWRQMLGTVVLMAAIGSVAGCGSPSGVTNPGSPGTTAGTYTFTVTGTGNPSITPAPTTKFTVTVN